MLAATARADQFQMTLARGINQNTIARRGHPQPFDVLHAAAHLKLQVLQDRSRRAHRRLKRRAAETIQRLHLEMVRQAVHRLIEQKQIALASLRAGGVAEQRNEVLLLLMEKKFRRLHAFQFIRQLTRVGEFSHLEFSGGVIDECEPQPPALTIYRRKVVGPVAVEQVQVINRACAEDLSNLTRHQFARHGLGRLLGDGDTLATLDQLGDIALRGMIGNAAHRDAAALGQGHIENRRGRLRILEEHLIKIAQPVKQQHIRRQLATNREVLLHHGSAGRV